MCSSQDEAGEIEVVLSAALTGKETAAKAGGIPKNDGGKTARRKQPNIQPAKPPFPKPGRAPPNFRLVGWEFENRYETIAEAFKPRGFGHAPLPPSPLGRRQRS